MSSRHWFHWHVADLGMEHVYIKPRTPQLNGKVERSHRTDKEEFYQLLTYKDDIDLEKKLATWEGFYNYDRPHRRAQRKDAIRSSEGEATLNNDVRRDLLHHT